MTKINLAVYGLTAGAVSILTLREARATGEMMPLSTGNLYKNWMSALVDHVILEKLLGYDKIKKTSG